MMCTEWRWRNIKSIKINIPFFYDYFAFYLLFCVELFLLISRRKPQIWKYSGIFSRQFFFCELTMIWSLIWNMMTKMFIQYSTPLCWSWRSFAPFLDAPWDNYFSFFFYIKKGDIIILVGHLQTDYMENSGQEKKRLINNFFC